MEKENPKLLINLSAINYDELPHIDVNDRKLPITLITNKCVYWKLVKKITQPPISQLAWDQLFEEQQNNWAHIFKIPYEVTFETQIQSFHYKILLRIFPCNWYVSKFDSSVVRGCLFCNYHTDDICHYFYDCILCRHFWDDFKS